MQYHVYSTIRTECTGSLMPLDGSSSLALQHLLTWTFLPLFRQGQSL